MIYRLTAGLVFFDNLITSHLSAVQFIGHRLNTLDSSPVLVLHIMNYHFLK